MPMLEQKSAGETASVVAPESTSADRAIAMNTAEPKLEKNISQNSTAQEAISEKAAQEKQDEEVQEVQAPNITKKKTESTPIPVTRDKSTAAVSTQKPRANTQEKIVAGANATKAGGNEIVSLSKKKFAAKEQVATTTDDLTEGTLALSDKKLSKKKNNLRFSDKDAPVKNGITLEKFAPTNEFENIVTPSGGWSAFNKYIATSKKSIQTLKPQPIRVSFTVTADGTLENIMTNKTTCSACQEEAIRLIKNSGKWKSETGKAEQIDYLIKF